MITGEAIKDLLDLIGSQVSSAALGILRDISLWLLEFSPGYPGT
jgi:hypothetical protein